MADITDAEIEHVATAMSAAGPGQSGHILSGLARAALTAAAEIGWGRKPTRSEARSIIDKKITFGTESTRERVTAALIEAGLAVEDPEPEWEPTTEAVNEVIRVYVDDRGARDESFVAVLKHIRAKPHLIGMGKGE